MTERRLSKREKFSLLEKIYRWFDEIAWPFRDWVCRPGCSTCCTSSVILTTLEAAFIWERHSGFLKGRMSTWAGENLLPPLKITTNEHAALCLARQDFEDDIQPMIDSQCPLLENHRCLCYEVRPLMCRMMFSTTLCGTTGEAETPSILLSLNIACLQLIEHIDKDGCSGYLKHLLPHFDNREFVNAYEMGESQSRDWRLRPNRSNPGFLIPPEHRAQMESWLRQLDRPQRER